MNDDLTLEGVECVHHDDTHNAFTDLCIYAGALYLTFRSCPDGHGVSPSSCVRILKRELEGGEWKEVCSFSVPDRDTRDPHFLEFRERLWVITGTWLCPESAEHARRELNDHLGYCVCSSDGESWSAPAIMQGTHGYYVWRAAAHGSRAYLCGRRKKDFGPGDSSDSRSWPRLQSVLLSSEDGVHYREAGLFQESYGEGSALVDLLTLPSGGDNSYPGFAALDGSRALVSYYSSHEGFRNSKGVQCSAIYLAEVRRR